MTSSKVDDRIDAGNRALAAGDWGRARELFRTALDGSESAPAWEGLGWTGWWLHDAAGTIEARVAAYGAYRDGGDPLGAGRVAGWLAADHREFRGDAAVANGWLGRAHRMLDGLEPTAEHGWLALHEGSFALSDGDGRTALRLADVATELGVRLQVPDLEAIGLAQQGIALVLRGDVDSGMRLLDEGSAIARGEKLQLPVSLAWALCYVIAACEGVGDFPRAIEWCEAMREFAERWRGRQILGLCRTAYGRILTTRGDWPAAESELTGAVSDFEASRPAMAGTGLVRLGELRTCQGRLGEARELFTRAASHPGAILGLGELALDGGDAIAAREAADRVLRRLDDELMLERLPALELRVRALVALGELDAAATDCATVQSVAARVGTPYLRGRASSLAAQLALGCRDGERARCEAEDAIDELTLSAAPYEAARARLLLARALAELGRDEHAAEQAALSRATFSALSAAGDVARVDAARAAPTRVAPAETSELTDRELEILRLIAAGFSDAQIAEQLVVSKHTIHRHVANIRTKLRLPSRAAAVAHASRAGLL